MYANDENDSFNCGLCLTIIVFSRPTLQVVNKYFFTNFRKELGRQWNEFTLRSLNRTKCSSTSATNSTATYYSKEIQNIAFVNVRAKVAWRFPFIVSSLWCWCWIINCGWPPLHCISTSTVNVLCITNCTLWRVLPFKIHSKLSWTITYSILSLKNASISSIWYGLSLIENSWNCFVNKLLTFRRVRNRNETWERTASSLINL